MQDKYPLKKIIVLTGSEIRHEFFRKSIAADSRIDVITTYCEGDEKSLQNRTEQNENSSELERLHVLARTQAEKDFFLPVIENIDDQSNPQFIHKGDINCKSIVVSTG